MLAPLGHYDLDEESWTLVAYDAEGTAVAAVEPDVIKKTYTGHTPPPPVNVTWLLPLDVVRDAGVTQVELYVLNGQGTYRLNHTVDVPASLYEAEPATPGFGATTLLVGLALVGVIALRRRTQTP